MNQKSENESWDGCLNVLNLMILLWVIFMLQGIGTTSWWKNQTPFGISVFISFNEFSLRDCLENILLPGPAAFLLGVRGFLIRRKFGSVVLFASLLLGTVGFVMEVGQFWIPGRQASLWDALNMFLGAGLFSTSGYLLSLRFQKLIAFICAKERFHLVVVSGLWIFSSYIPHTLELSPGMFQQALRPLFQWSSFQPTRSLVEFASCSLVLWILRPFTPWRFLVGLLGLRLLGFVISPGRYLELSTVFGIALGLGITAAFERFRRPFFALLLLGAMLAIFLETTFRPECTATSPCEYQLGMLFVVTEILERKYLLLLIPFSCFVRQKMYGIFETYGSKAQF